MFHVIVGFQKHDLHGRQNDQQELQTGDNEVKEIQSPPFILDQILPVTIDQINALRG